LGRGAAATPFVAGESKKIDRVGGLHVRFCLSMDTDRRIRV
jgi:hypothetical protein